jgi:hypothetical protein
MPIYLDDEPADLSGATLDAVLDAARERASQSGRVVVEVQADGRPLLGEELEARRGAPLGSADLRLYTADPREREVTTLGLIGARLADARQAQTEAAELLQQDQPAEAMKRVGQAIEVWQEAQRAVLYSAALTGVRLEERTFDGRPFTAFTDELLTRIKGLRDLIASRDTVALADALAYEWPEVIDRWERLIVELIGWIEGL